MLNSRNFASTNLHSIQCWEIWQFSSAPVRDWRPIPRSWRQFCWGARSDCTRPCSSCPTRRPWTQQRSANTFHCFFWKEELLEFISERILVASQTEIRNRSLLFLYAPLITNHLYFSMEACPTWPPERRLNSAWKDAKGSRTRSITLWNDWNQRDN